jgi:hypothetical protein
MVRQPRPHNMSELMCTTADGETAIHWHSQGQRQLTRGCTTSRGGEQADTKLGTVGVGSLCSTSSMLDQCSRELLLG